mgnify:CR=1 FL=1
MLAVLKSVVMKLFWKEAQLDSPVGGATLSLTLGSASWPTRPNHSNARVTDMQTCIRRPSTASFSLAPLAVSLPISGLTRCPPLPELQATENI